VDFHSRAKLHWSVPSYLNCYIYTILIIVYALRSFKPGSAAGPDGLRPQHIQDMVQEMGTLLISSLVYFVNHVLSGVVIFGGHYFSGDLSTLKKIIKKVRRKRCWPFRFVLIDFVTTQIFRGSHFFLYQSGSFKKIADFAFCFTRRLFKFQI